jgi:hypothetical protein
MAWMRYRLYRCVVGSFSRCSRRHRSQIGVKIPRTIMRRRDRDCWGFVYRIVPGYQSRPLCRVNLIARPSTCTTLNPIAFFLLLLLLFPSRIEFLFYLVLFFFSLFRLDPWAEPSTSESLVRHGRAPAIAGAPGTHTHTPGSFIL